MVHLNSTSLHPISWQQYCEQALGVPEVIYFAVHDVGRMPLLNSISRFHMSILRLLLIVLVWVHWDACLNYGACAYQAAPRFPITPLSAQAAAKVCYDLPCCSSYTNLPIPGFTPAYVVHKYFLYEIRPHIIGQRRSDCSFWE